MQVLVNGDNRITVRESLETRVISIVEASVSRFAEQITRVEVHLGDVNADKSGDDDKRCMMEARIAGLQPIAVTHQAESLLQAIEGASEKLQRALESTLGKMRPY